MTGRLRLCWKENNMDNEEQKHNVRQIINNLLYLDYSKKKEIAIAEKKLEELSKESDDNSCALVGLMLTAIMSGNRKKACEIDELIWQKGGILSDFFLLIYSDNLINLGKIEKLKMVLGEKLENIGNNLKHFYNIFTRYALLTGDLALIARINEYENLEIREEVLFNFAKKTAFNFTSIDYRNIIKIILDNLKDELCAFDYGIYENGKVEIVCYTPNQEIKNAADRQKINKEIAEYSETTNRHTIENLDYKIKNISLHPAWIK